MRPQRLSKFGWGSMIQMRIFFFFLVAPYGMWDLSSPTRDQTRIPCLTCEASLMDQWWRIHLQCRGHWRFRLNPWSGRSPREGHGNPLQYSCLENPMDRGAWCTTVHRVTKRQTRLNTNTTILTYENRRFWRDAFFSIPTKKKKKCLIYPSLPEVFKWETIFFITQICI